MDDHWLYFTEQSNTGDQEGILHETETIPYAITLVAPPIYRSDTGLVLRRGLDY